MNPWLNLLQGLLLGGVLGIVYGFLRPLRWRWLGDLFFIGALFYFWIYLGFGICGGDLRFAYTAALLLGCFLWYQCFGPWLAPLFSAFWKGFFSVLAGIFAPLGWFCKKCAFFKNFSLQAGKNGLQ